MKPAFTRFTAMPALMAGLVITATAAPASAQHLAPKAAVPTHGSESIIVRGDMRPISVNNDSNSFWLDYRTDLSEAERELESDLARATDAEDEREAYAEYYSEIEDARSDYSQEMRERGFRVLSFEPNNERVARR